MKSVSADLLLMASQTWFKSVPKSNSELIGSLTKAQILKTPAVIQAMQSIDRGLYTQGVYSNDPFKVGKGQVLTSPSMQALTLEVLCPYLEKANRIIDIGCGIGYLTLCMSVLSPSAEIKGIDFYKTLIEKAKEMNKKLSFVCCDAFEVLEDEFDVIHVGFAATEDLCEFLREKLSEKGVLLSPLATEETIGWWMFDKQNKQYLGDAAFSQMVKPCSLDMDLAEVEEEIKSIYKETEIRLKRRPNIGDLPQHTHELLKKRRVIQAKKKKFEEDS